MRPSRTKKHQVTPQPYTRMSLRSFRNVPVVTMETSSSSSSDDSCDSFGSDGFGSAKRRAKTCGQPAGRGGVVDISDVSAEMMAMKVGTECARRGRRTQALKVALKFPNKKEKKPEPQQHQNGSEDEDENFMEKRALNIKENKAMLAKLMAEISKIPGLDPTRLSLTAGNTQPSRAPRRSLNVSGPRRRNPERTSRPHTRSRSLIDGPPTPPPEEEEEDKFSLVRRSGAGDEGDEPQPPRRRNYNNILTIQHVVRPVEDITEAELDKICFSVRDKVYSSCTGSTCHQCRQKTTDTKTNCRNPECVGVRGQFCGPCLRNRYGEEVRDALLSPDWQCPPCRGICNCSFCRAREGRCATGVLVYLAKYHGYDNVHAYLNSLKRELEESQESA